MFNFYSFFLSGLILLLAPHSALALGSEKGEITSAPSFFSPLHLTNGTDQVLESRAKSFVEKMADEGIGFLGNEDLSESERKKAFEKLLQKNFDMKTIGRFALGRYWKTSSKAEREEYLKLFEDMIIDVYSRRFNDYNGQSLDIISARTEGASDFMVFSEIVPQDGPKISVDWRVRKKKNGSFKIVDIMVEGVSMSLTQRSDFASVIQRGGGKVEVLLVHLRENNQEN